MIVQNPGCTHTAHESLGCGRSLLKILADTGSSCGQMSLVMPTKRLVVALDDGYASYDQEEELFAKAGARFSLQPCKRNENAACVSVRDADIVLVRESPVSRRVIDAMTRCKAIIRYGIGVDNID